LVRNGSKGGILDAGQLLPLAPNQQTISELCRTSFDGEGLASRTAAVPQTAADFRHRQWCDLPELIVSMNWSLYGFRGVEVKNCEKRPIIIRKPITIITSIASIDTVSSPDAMLVGRSNWRKAILGPMERTARGATIRTRVWKSDRISTAAAKYL